MSSSQFSKFELRPEILTVIGEMGFEKMTAIQEQSLPFLLKGQDLVGQSKTGSGKTLAFTIPILQKLKMPRRDIQALIMCPTRELCTQVAREIRQLGRRLSGLQVLILSGGQEIRPQLLSLHHGAHIVVGTPGRILDLIGRNKLDLNFVSTLVLDEADRMLDMGFQDDMEKIISELSRIRQTLFFSATFPENMKSMSDRYQIKPINIKIEDEPESLPAIEQKFCLAEGDVKQDLLLRVLRQIQPESALVFCNLKTTVTELTAKLQKQGLSCAGLSGDLDQDQRNSVLARFRNGSARIVVATDVAARGLDIKDLPLVINFDFPIDEDTYVHRIGRTGRAGQTGQAVIFVAPSEIGKFAEMKLNLGLEIKAMEFDSGRARQGLQEAQMETIYISGGRKEKVRPGDILGALTGEAGGLSGQDIGKIEIHDQYSFVAVKKSLAPGLLQRLKEGRIKGRRFFIKIAE